MDGGDRAIRYPFGVPAEGEAVEVAEGVLWLRVPLPMALDHVNAFALDDGDGWTLVDTGMNNARARALWLQLIAGPLGGRPVRRVVATHFHPDHVGLAGWFQLALGAEVLTSRVTWLYTRMQMLDPEHAPRPETLAFWRAAGLGAETYVACRDAGPFDFAEHVAPLSPEFVRLDEGGTLDAGGRRWDIRFGQGHAPDHLTFWSRDDGLVLGGDQFLPSISPNVGVFAVEPRDRPLGDWLGSLGRFARFAREDQLILPGHKLPYRGLPGRLEQLAEGHAAALGRLGDWLAVPRRACDCFPALFRREVGRGEYLLALGEALAHLNHLVSQGEAIRETDGDGVWWYRRRQERAA